MESNSTRIAKNTLFLYLRSIFVLLVSLYTSREVLRILGVENYGIYNVVGGLISIVSFLKTTMSATYQRYFNFEMGRRDDVALTNLFRTSMSVQLIFAIIVVFLAETIGLWFLNNKLVIPYGRLYAANIVYQTSVISLVLTIFQAPFNALIIAYEKIKIFAIVSIIDAILKLVIVLSLPYINFDSLIAYSILMLLITIFNAIVYVIVCKNRFFTCDIAFNWDKNNLKTVLSFGGWGMIDSLSYVLNSQGINVLLNIFFGAVINAARGIAYQVLSAVEMFITNFQTSFRPQLIKSYAEGDLNYMYKLYYSATKISLYLLWALSLPIIIETPTILKFWLGNSVPEYTVAFIRIALLTALINVYANPTSAIAYATGNIKSINIIVNGTNLLILPISYIFLIFGYGPVSVMIINFVMAIIVHIVRLLVLKKLLVFSITAYVKKVVAPTLLVVITSPIVPYLGKFLIKESIMTSILICFISVVSVIILSMTIGINKYEREMIRSKLRKVVNI